MIRSKSFVWGAGSALAAAIVFGAATAAATPSVSGLTLDTCGKWIVKVRDFGKFKIRRYNDFIPENFQVAEPPSTLPTFDVPRVRVAFGVTFFAMTFYFADEMGVLSTRSAIGTYEQNGKKLKMELSPSPSDEGVRWMFKNLGELALFGARDLVSLIEGPLVVDPAGGTVCVTDPGPPEVLGTCTGIPTLDRLKISARLNDNFRLKLKLKGRLTYDIDTDIVDQRGSRGKLKFTGKGEQCPLPPPA